MLATTSGPPQFWHRSKIGDRQRPYPEGPRGDCLSIVPNIIFCAAVHLVGRINFGRGASKTQPGICAVSAGVTWAIQYPPVCWFGLR